MATNGKRQRSRATNQEIRSGGVDNCPYLLESLLLQVLLPHSLPVHDCTLTTDPILTPTREHGNKVRINFEPLSVRPSVCTSDF